MCFKAKAKENNQTLFSEDTRKKFALAKCRNSNNLLGYYIIENYSIDYKLIEMQVKRLISRAYKNSDNMLTQLERIRATIINETSKDISIGKLIELRTHSVKLRGVE
jgi:hypothetical protein